MLLESTCETRQSKKHISHGDRRLTVSHQHAGATGKQRATNEEHWCVYITWLTNDTYHPVGVIYPVHAYLRYKFNSRAHLRVSRAAYQSQAVYSVLVIGLGNRKADISSRIYRRWQRLELLRWLCLLWPVRWSCPSTTWGSCRRHSPGPSWLCHRPRPSALLQAPPTSENCVEL